MGGSGNGGGLGARRRSAAGLLAGAAMLCGCAAPVGLTLIGAAASSGASAATSYSLDGSAYKTFTAPQPKVQRATLAALRKMDLKVQPSPPAQNGATPSIIATGRDREIEIELEPISSQTTRLRVVAKEGIFFRDKATAAEIIAQVAGALEKGRS